jgi:hypothetical protein
MISFFILVGGLCVTMVAVALIDGNPWEALVALSIVGVSLIGVSFIVLEVGICTYRCPIGMSSTWTRGDLAYLFAVPPLVGWILYVSRALQHWKFPGFTGFLSVVAWSYAWSLRWRQKEAFRRAWQRQEPVGISEASVEQVADAARGVGSPYFTLTAVAALETKQYSGKVLRAVLEAEERPHGPDREAARASLDEVFQELSPEHKITAKQILRGWVAHGVPQHAGDDVALSTVISLQPQWSATVRAETLHQHTQHQ